MDFLICNSVTEMWRFLYAIFQQSAQRASGKPVPFALPVGGNGKEVNNV